MHDAQARPGILDAGQRCRVGVYAVKEVPRLKSSSRIGTQDVPEKIYLLPAAHGQRYCRPKTASAAFLEHRVCSRKVLSDNFRTMRRQ
jgi:hypothetical protein